MDQDATPHRMLLERNLLFTAVTRSKHFGGHWSDEGIGYDPRVRRFNEASTVDRTMSDRKLP